MTIVLILINMCSVMVHVLLTAVYDNSTNTDKLKQIVCI